MSDSTPAASGSFTLTVTVRNRGDAESEATMLRYYRSSSDAISAGDEELGAKQVGELAPGGASEESIDLRAPPTAGTYHYGACVDSLTEESVRDNNCSPSVSIRIDAGGQSRPPRNARATITFEGPHNRVTWGPVSEATFYRVNYCWNPVEGGVCGFVFGYNVIASVVADTTYLHRNVARPPPGLTYWYYYIVQACNVAVVHH